MKFKDQILLEEAYDSVQLNESFIPSFLKEKIKELFSSILNQIREINPEEYDKIALIIKTKNTIALKNLFEEYDTETELKKLMPKKEIQEEGFVSGIKSAWSTFGKFMITLSNLVLGRRGSTRELISCLLILILGICHIMLLGTASTSTVLLGMNLIEILFTTHLGILTSVFYMLSPFIVTRAVQTEIDPTNSKRN